MHTKEPFPGDTAAAKAETAGVTGAADFLENDGDSGLIQASFRLPRRTHEAIRASSLKRGISQSELMRAACALYQLTEALPPHQKPAIVDLRSNKDDNSRSPDHYKVISWLLTE